MESNKRSKREKILHILCHFGKKNWNLVLLGFFLFKKTSLPILHWNSFGLSLISLVFKTFFWYLASWSWCFRFAQAKGTYFQKQLINFLK